MLHFLVDQRGEFDDTPLGHLWLISLSVLITSLQDNLVESQGELICSSHLGVRRLREFQNIKLGLLLKFDCSLTVNPLTPKIS